MNSVYTGRIRNGGAQVVKAPMQSVSAKKGAVHIGADLRGGGEPAGLKTEHRKSKAGK